jgi:hypothetical protein
MAFVTALGTNGGLVALASGGIVALGLHWDALKQQSKANDLLAQALADGRVHAPSLEHLESSATAIAKRSVTDERREALVDAIRAIARAVTLTNAIASAPTRIYAARDAVAEARKCLTHFETRLPMPVTERGIKTLTALEEVTQLWVTAWEHPTAPPPDWATRADTRRVEAVAEYEGLRVVAREALDRLRTEALPPTDQRPAITPSRQTETVSGETTTDA